MQKGRQQSSYSLSLGYLLLLPHPGLDFSLGGEAFPKSRGLEGRGRGGAGLSVCTMLFSLSAAIHD